MKETVIIDLAILKDDQKRCPVCGSTLVLAPSLYRYPGNNGRLRTSYLNTLKCRQCNQCFGTYGVLESLRNVDIPIGKTRWEVLSYHKFEKSDSDDSNTYRFSETVEVERKDTLTISSEEKKKKKRNEINLRKRDSLAEALKYTQFEKSEPIFKEIESAPAPVMGPVATTAVEEKKLGEDKKKENDKEVYDLTILPEFRKQCPRCKSELKQVKANYHYRVNGRDKTFSSDLLYCTPCSQVFGTIKWLNQLEKREYRLAGTENIDIQFAYHYEGEEKDNNDERMSELLGKSNPIEKKTISKTTVGLGERAEEKSFQQLFRQLHAPSSTYLIMECSENETDQKEVLILVSEHQDQNGIKHVYHTESRVGKAVIEAVLKRSNTFELNGYHYSVLGIYKGPDFERVVSARRKILKVFEKPSELVDVYVYELKGVCRKHGRNTERLVVNMISSRSDDPHPLEVYYCPFCAKFYVNQEAYFRFYRKYGMPPVRLHGESAINETKGNLLALRDHSDLYLFGYSVSGDMGYDPSLRQAILEDVIDSGNLTKSQVTSHLEWLIRFSRNNSKMVFARQLWQQDLEYIENYKPKMTNIWGKFKPGSTRVFL